MPLSSNWPTASFCDIFTRDGDSGWPYQADGITDGETNYRSKQNVPGPGDRGGESDSDEQHEGQRQGHAGHHADLICAFRQHAEQERAEHRAVNQRGYGQPGGED